MWFCCRSIFFVLQCCTDLIILICFSPLGFWDPKFKKIVLLYINIGHVLFMLKYFTLWWRNLELIWYWILFTIFFFLFCLKLDNFVVCVYSSVMDKSLQAIGENTFTHLLYYVAQNISIRTKWAPNIVIYTANLRCVIY